VTLAATDLAMDHQFSIWDAVILSAAAASGCRLLLSEDLQEGFTRKAVSVTNPLFGEEATAACRSSRLQRSILNPIKPIGRFNGPTESDACQERRLVTASIRCGKGCFNSYAPCRTCIRPIPERGPFGHAHS
jgi:hypothetical protein